jgi:hypothetical protein
MTDLERKRVNQLTNLGTLQTGDTIVGERTSGTTGVFTVGSLGGSVDSVNSQTGTVTLDADDISDTSTTNKYTTAADKTRLANTSGTNTGDQASIVGITGTKAQFDAAVTDGNFLYSGDVTQYTDEMAQDAVGAMVDSSLTYVDGTPLLQRAALTGDVTASAGSNSTTIANGAVTLAKQADVATSTVFYRKTASTGSPEVQTLATLKTDLGLTGTNSGDQTSIVGITGTKAQFDAAVTDGDIVYTDSLGTNVATFLATPSSANLRAALTDETGTGSAVFATSPTLETPVLGTPTSGDLSNCTGMGWTLLSTGTANSSATLDFTIPSGYTNFKFVAASVAPATDGVNLWIRTSTDGGSSYDAGASDYRYGNSFASSLGAASNTGSNAAAQFVLGGQLGNSTEESISAEIIVVRPANAKNCRSVWNTVQISAAGSFNACFGGGERLSSADVDRVRFLMSSGNIATGTIQLYGIL